MDEKEMRQRIRECFTNYEITEASISCMPDIISDIMQFIEDVEEAAFTRGVEAAQEG